MPIRRNDLKLNSYHYHLKSELIASRPTSDRSSCKLLVYHTTEVLHKHFYDLPHLIPDTTLVLNESKVLTARFFGHKVSGGKVELFLLSIIPKNNIYNVLIKQHGKKTLGQKIIFRNFNATIVEKYTDSFGVIFSKNIKEVLKDGKMPIPPYIRKGVGDKLDEDSYQTVYAKNPGSVAAPTAGLHFDKQLLTKLKAANIQIAYVTLHVGIGTFSPIKCANITDHTMHAENFIITKENYLKIKKSRNLIAVGTTTLRVLESISKMKNFIPDTFYSTNLFIYPGYKFSSGISGMITNFHLPKSSLLILMAALIGRKKILELYDIAIQNNYRFFSYGDAMLILNS